MALELDDRQRAMLQEMGVQVWLPGTAFAVAPDAIADRRNTAQVTSRRPAPATTREPSPAVLAAVATADGNVPGVASLDWTELRNTASTCKACGLCAGRKNTTLQPPLTEQGWQGQADWMVVGDPPDDNEDAAGSAFADASGALLANMLRALNLVRINDGSHAENAVGRTAVPPQNAAYVTNVVKCRAPHGAMPQAADLVQCAAYLQREIALLQPKMILAMGRFANQMVLAETPALVNQPLGKLRGSVYRYQGVPVVLTYHPKTLMRNSADKAKAWADLCLAADTLQALDR